MLVTMVWCALAAGSELDREMALAQTPAALIAQTKGSELDGESPTQAWWCRPRFGCGWGGWGGWGRCGWGGWGGWGLRNCGWGGWGGWGCGYRALSCGWPAYGFCGGFYPYYFTGYRRWYW
jgi:hypothetical protein